MRGMVPMWLKQTFPKRSYRLSSRWVGRLTILDLAKIGVYMRCTPTIRFEKRGPR